MYQSEYYIDRSTDTFADTLLAFGVAELLSQLLQEQQGETGLRIRDDGGHFTVRLAAPLRPGAELLPWFSMLTYIETKRKKPPAEWVGRIIDYEATKLRQAQYFELRKQLPPAARRPGATVDEHPELAQLAAYQPPSDWPVMTQINQMQGIGAYEKVQHNWLECRVCFPELVCLLLRLFSQAPNDEAATSARWRMFAKQYKLEAHENVPLVQVVNPAMGKGINRAKADGAERLGNSEGFWLLEYLKFVGLFQAGVPHVIKVARAGGGKAPRDRKTYVLHPYNIQYHVHKRIYERFSAEMWSNTAIKMDVLAALKYTDVFLEQWIAGQADDPEWGEEPGDHVRGLATAFYKDLGSAPALLNLSEVALPQWMRVRTKAEGEQYRAIIEEHRRVVGNLDEGKAEGNRLLTAYRDFLSGHDLASLFEFTGAYATLLMSQMERGQWTPQFTTTSLEALVTEHDRKLTPILHTPGFQHIADAIRLSTVRPQHFKAKGSQGPYDIRYGLGNDLLRQASYPDRFIQALSAFVYAYNQETGQVFERYKGQPPVRRARVTTGDLEEVIALIDQYGSRTVANLLIAFGYARSPRDPEHGHEENNEPAGEDVEPE